ncbi:PREDICTED: protein lin-52 homolog [Tinamus guttatus]|nr:PREDICTED: protein lin-52 homolog [Tinamus guttatus]
MRIRLCASAPASSHAGLHGRFSLPSRCCARGPAGSNPGAAARAPPGTTLNEGPREGPGAARPRRCPRRGLTTEEEEEAAEAIQGLYGVFVCSPKQPITSSPPKWMAELENDDIDMLKELGSLTTANLMEKVRGLQNLAYQLGLDESREMTRGKFLNILEKPKK